ncbi:hypothetical protein [Dyadobacter sp. CY326]|uniref:hypothetical protein n=1 Tax=Dyadobacter sp. CY326 TaxID=2907300 RepID=UPI001F1D900D|nr:hypothetical protein [Dyadobacter sp. CY326]MCE7064167.1 hypothetical protein [Dyadobacter sp. CY326]
MRTIKSKDAVRGISNAGEYSGLPKRPSVLNEPGFIYQKLDPSKFGRVINSELTDEELEMANDPNVKPFSHISDSAEYVRKIRKTTKP